MPWSLHLMRGLATHGCPRWTFREDEQSPNALPIQHPGCADRVAERCLNVTSRGNVSDAIICTAFSKRNGRIKGLKLQ